MNNNIEINFTGTRKDLRDFLQDFLNKEEKKDILDTVKQDEFTHIIQRGRNWSYNKDFELYDADHNFIKKFESLTRLIGHFRPSNKF